jgi:predicted transcriptional regulator
MSSEKQMPQMSIETMQTKLSNQKKFIDQLTTENEELFHQFNHLMIRNTKLLKRVDDLQNIIDDLHIRIEELQLINSNQMQMNDNLRRRTDMAISKGSARISGDPADMKYFSTIENIPDPADNFDLEALFEKWKNFPGQKATNAPNLRKQVLMLVHLYNNKQLRAAELFNLSGVGGVTGARFVSTLKKFDLIHYTGARKKFHYEITEKGKAFIESDDVESSAGTGERESAKELANKRGIQAKYQIPGPRQSSMNRDDL